MNGMRPLITVVFLLLHSFAASAQPVISDEVLSDLLRSRTAVIDVAAPVVAMARDRQGLVIAATMWNASGINAVYVARLDSAGRVAAPVVEIPPATTSKEVDAYWPSLAVSPTGTGFTLAWIELLRAPLADSASVFYSQLDADLKPSAPRLLTTMRATDIVAPAIVRSGKSTWISLGGSVWEIFAGGSLGQPLDAGTAVSDMVATSDYPQVVSGESTRTGSFACLDQQGCLIGAGIFHGYCYERCRIYQNLALRFVSLYTGSAARTSTFRSEARPAIQSDGRDVLVAWMDGDQNTGGTVTAIRLSATSFDTVAEDLQGGQDIGTFGPDTVPTRPDIATDGERFVIVWSTKTPAGDHDIVGASIDREGQVTSFSIATSSADEHDPSVLMTAAGNFLVAYEKLSNNERRVATRFLKFNRRRRAVH